MAYTTETKVKVLLTGVSSVNAQFITMAESVINAKLGGRYTVPFTTTPPLIESIATGLAAYFCMQALFTADSQNSSAWVESVGKMWMDLLNAIADGITPLVDSTGAEISVKNNLLSTTAGYTPVFDVDGIESQVVDPDRLDDIAAAKE